MPLGFDTGGDGVGWHAGQWNGGEHDAAGRRGEQRRGPRMSVGIVVVAVVATGAVSIGLLGRGPSTTPAAGGTAVTVCGRPLAPAGAATGGLHALPGVGGGTGAPAAGTVALPWGTAGGEYLLRVADGCAHGASVRLAPARDVRVARTVTAADGLPVAVAVEPVYAGESELLVSRPGRPTATVTFQVVALPGG